MIRSFSTSTGVHNNQLHLALAPGLSQDGWDEHLSFFRGFSTRPHILARSLGVLAEISATAYLHHTPTSERDPIFSAHGDRLRAECFSACNSVYACVEFFAPGFDGGTIGHGTTNIDLNPASRTALTAIDTSTLLHLDIGVGGVCAATPDVHVTERTVNMPQRWIPALGNVAALHQHLTPVFSVNAHGARSFIASVPSAHTTQSVWITAKNQSITQCSRHHPHAVFITGLHRLSPLKRLLSVVTGMTLYRPTDAGHSGVVIIADLPDARITISLTGSPSRGYSGEGSLLGDLAGGVARRSHHDDAEIIATLLSFEPAIDINALAHHSGLSTTRVRAVITLFAAVGRVGWNISDATFFHRELPNSPTMDDARHHHPRLMTAHSLGAERALRRLSDHTFIVTSGERDYEVELGAHPHAATCTCAWFLAYGDTRGPCKHILAASSVTAP